MKPLSVILLIFLILTPSVNPVNSLRAQANRTPQALKEHTNAACLQVRNYLKEYKQFQTQTGTGEIELFRVDEDQSERKGCRVSSIGPSPQNREEHYSLPRIGSFLQDNGWEQIGLYAADGPYDSQQGLYKKGTFCLATDGSWDFEANGPSSTNYFFAVTCVDAYRTVIIE